MPDPTTQKDFIIRFKKGKVVDEALGLRLFKQSSQSGDIGEFDFTILKSASPNFHYKDQFEKLLTGKSPTLVLAAHHKNVEIHSDVDKKKIIYKAKTTITTDKSIFTEPPTTFAKLMLLVHNSNKNCGIDDSQDPGCRFLKLGTFCDPKKLKINSSLLEITGEIIADLNVSKKNKDKNNKLIATVTPYSNMKVVTDLKQDSLTVKKIDFIPSPKEEEKDDTYKFKDTLKVNHNGKKEICYLIEIKWHDDDNTTSSVPFGRLGKGYTNNLKFTIGKKEKNLPFVQNIRSHIEWE